MKVALQQFSGPFSKIIRQKRKDNPKENPIMWNTLEDRLQRQSSEFLSNDDALSRMRIDSFRTGTLYEKLLLHSKHFCRTATSPE